MSSKCHALRQFVRNTLVITVAGVAAVLTAMPLQAAVLDELTVTAQKREQDIQDVGISVSAFTGDQMKALGIQDSFDIAMFIPNVNISGNLAGQNTQFSIRGVTQNDFNDIIEAPVAVYLDEGYIPIAQGQTFALFDIERVEVLKGPQSTLFGRNATGGVVQYISKKPSFDGMEAYVDATYGQYDTSADPNYSRFEAAIGGPFTKTLAGRISGLYESRDPYLENLYRNDTANVNDANRFGAGTFIGDNSFTANAPVALPATDAGADLGETETVAVRGILEFDPSDSLRFTLMANYAKTDMATGPYQSKPTIGVYDGTFAGLDPTIPVPGGDPGGQLSQGELLNVLDVAPNESRLSICAPGGVDNGEDCGADANNDATPDALRGFGIDQGRLSNIFALTPGGDFFGYKDPDGDDWTFSGDFAFADSGDMETTGLQLRVEWDLASMTLTSISDYKDYEKLMFIDVDSAPVNQSANYAGVDADSFSQELRLNGGSDRLQWVAGLYYLHIDTDSDNGLKFPVNSIVGLFDLGSDAQLQTDSYSLFGQVDWEVVNGITLIAGLRAIQEEKDYHFEQSLYFGNTDSRTIHQGFQCSIGPGFDPGAADPACPGAAFEDSTSDTLWAGKLQLDWRLTDDWLLYAGLNRGVKAGSFNAQLAGGLPVPLSSIPYDDETLHSFETGFKSTWFGGTTRFNGTFFYYDYNDYQAFLFGGVSGIVINQDAETYGLEFEVQTSPIEGLDALLSIGWFDATVQDVPLRAEAPSDGGAAPCTAGSTVICKDVEPVYAPSTQVAGLLRYEWSIGPGMMNVQGDFSWSDSFYYNLRNFDADQFDSYTLVNAVVGWVSPEEHWAVNLAARNLTDENAGIQGFDLATLCGCNEISFRAPRRYEVNVKFSF
jgi:iron complex outermembrane receptor protein